MSLLVRRFVALVFCALSLPCVAQVKQEPKANQKTVAQAKKDAVKAAQVKVATQAAQEKKDALLAEQKKKQETQDTSPEAVAAAKSLAAAAATSIGGMDPEQAADYIPCRFTLAELTTLQMPEQVLTLGPARVEALLREVELSIEHQAETLQINLAKENALLKQLANLTEKGSLIGLTPSQALQKIIEALNSGMVEARAGETGPKADPLKAKADGKPVALAAEEQQTTREISPVIKSARETIALLVRPTDVGCSMSVLSYDETTKAYGYLIAKNYIAVQVVVRNLNRDQQFVLHDVEMAVSTDPGGRPGRFYSGRDKVIVRSLSAAEASFDPRNIIVHGVQSLGALLSTLVPIYGGGVGDAAAVFNGGFYPGLDKVWRDMSTDQLNLLNDTGFSSTSSSQTVVPKTGTAMFVTFIPSKQFQQGWWTQDCVNKSSLGTIGRTTVKAIVPLRGGQATQYQAPTIDLDAALTICVADAKGRTTAERNWWGSHKHTQASAVSPEGIATEIPTRSFRQWSGNQLAVFEELSTVVVAGMHVVDDKDLEIKVAQVTCPHESNGTVLFANPDTGTLECEARGKNLDKVSLLRLRSGAETAFAEGKISLSGGDNTVAAVKFTTADLHRLGKTDYLVEAVTRNGVEVSTGQALHFSDLPGLSGVKEATLDVSSLKDTDVVKVTLTGWKLEKVSAVVGTFPGVDPASKTDVKLPLAGAPVRTDTQLTLELTGKLLGTKPLVVPLSLQLADGKTLVPAGFSLTLTAPIAPIAPVVAK